MAIWKIIMSLLGYGIHFTYFPCHMNLPLFFSCFYICWQLLLQDGWVHTHTHKFTFTLSYNYIGKKNPQKQKNRVNLKQCGEKYPSVDNNIGKVVKALKMIDEIFLKKLNPIEPKNCSHNTSNIESLKWYASPEWLWVRIMTRVMWIRQMRKLPFEKL